MGSSSILINGIKSPTGQLQLETTTMASTPSFQEAHISQIPAVQFLQKLGYRWISQKDAYANSNSL